MRNMIVALCLMPLATGLSMGPSEASEKCHIGDAALCLSTPGCHWDYDARGCVEGEARKQDACAVHEDPNICNSNKTFNCVWSDTDKKCASKSG